MVKDSHKPPSTFNTYKKRRTVKKPCVSTRSTTVPSGSLQAAMKIELTQWTHKHQLVSVLLLAWPWIAIVWLRCLFLDMIGLFILGLRCSIMALTRLIMTLICDIVGLVLLFQFANLIENPYAAAQPGCKRWLHRTLIHIVQPTNFLANLG